MERELRGFKQEFGGRPVSEAQELRAFFVAWFAVFLPEAFPQDFVQAMKDWASNLRDRSDFLTHNWHEALPLDMALFALTNDYWWLRLALQNVNHGNSSLREIAVHSLALVAHRLDFNDSELHQRIAFNLESQQLYSDECIVLMAVAQGKPESKRELFKEWKSLYGALPFGGDVLGKLLNGELVGNPLLAHFLRVTQYVNLRLAEEINQAQIRATSAPHSAQMLLQLSSPEEPLAQRMWHRLRSHPLNASHIALERVTQP